MRGPGVQGGDMNCGNVGCTGAGAAGEGKIARLGGRFGSRGKYCQFRKIRRLRQWELLQAAYLQVVSEGF